MYLNELKQDGDDIKQSEEREEKEAQEEDGISGVPRSKAVLDHSNTVLAMGEGRRRR